MGRLASVGLLVLLLVPSNAFAVSLSAPKQAVIGTKIDVTWDGPGHHYDTIWVSAPDSPDEVKGTGRALINHGRNPVQVILPEVPGTYELRYWLRNEKRVLTRRTIEVVDVPTSLFADESASAGATLVVAWEGPGNRYDCISLVPAGSPEDTKAVVEVLAYGSSPTELLLPETPGDYELRYQTSTIRRTLARWPLTIRPVAASLDAPKVAQMGEEILIHWQGPGHRGDWVGFYEVGDSKANHPLMMLNIPTERRPLKLRLPEETGDYELRYITYQDRNILATHALTVEDLPASRQDLP